MGQKTKKDVGAIASKSGVSFRVWAPFAERVSVTGSFNGWSEFPLNSELDGYWSVFVPHAEAGQEYKYIIHKGDNTFLRNDPRARQFTTTAGNSVIVDDDFDWGEQPDFVLPPIEQQIIYEMHVGTFNRADASTVGTFETAMTKLDHLKDLGITTIELMPVTSMSEELPWWGYTPEYIYSVENLYGGRYQLLEFVKAAHAKGIGVILDVVYNHFGPGKGMDLWQFDGWSQDGKGGIYFYNDWRSSTPWGETRPDYGRTEVSQFLLDNVQQWFVDFRLDGLRVDSTIFIRNAKGFNDNPDTDISEGWYFLQQLNRLAKKINPNALVVGEDVGANDFITKPIDSGGAGFMTQWQITFPHAIRSALDPSNDSERDIDSVVSELKRTFNGNPFEKVIYSDSHDSAANGGARLNSEISPSNPSSTAARQRSLIAAGIILSAPAIPMLFQGQELMQGGTFNDWESIDWERAEKFKGIILAHKHLIALRKNSYSNTRGLSGKNLNFINVDGANKVIAYHRWQDGGPNDDVVVVVNFSSQMFNEYKLSFPRSGKWRVRFNSTWSGYSEDFKDIAVNDVIVDNNQGTIILPPSCLLIFSQDD